MQQSRSYSVVEGEEERERRELFSSQLLMVEANIDQIAKSKSDNTQKSDIKNYSLEVQVRGSTWAETYFILARLRLLSSVSV